MAMADAEGWHEQAGVDIAQLAWLARIVELPIADLGERARMRTVYGSSSFSHPLEPFITVTTAN